MDFFIRRSILLFAVFGVVFNVTASEEGGQDDEQFDIESISVTTSASQPVVRESAPVQSVGKGKIEALGWDQLDEAIRSFSGVNITDYGGLGGVKTVSVRSLGAHHTAVSYDGVVVSNAQGGQIDLGLFSLDNVDEVTLTIGQSDEIFQSARSFESSGVINIRSSAPQFIDQRIKAGVKMEVGSFEFYNPTLDLALKISERWSASMSADWTLCDGDYPFTLTNVLTVSEEIRNNSDVNTLRAELNIFGEVGRRGGKIQIKGSYYDSERGLPGGVIYYNTTATERLWDKIQFLQAHYSTDLDDRGRWSLISSAKYNYSWSQYSDWSNKYEGGYYEEQYTQQEVYLSGGVRFKPTDRWSFTLSEDIFENILVTTLGDCPDPFRFTSLTTVAGQYRTDRLTLTASLLGRFSHEWAKYDTYEIAPDRQHLSPSVSGSYLLFEEQGIRVRASVKDGYRVPTFNDLYYSSMGNTTLLPERAMQYNVGLTYGGEFLPNLLDYTTLTLDLYYNKVSDKIVAIPTMFIWKMMNLGEVEIRGVDLNLSTHFTPFDGVKVNLSGNYTYQSAIDVTSPDDKNYRDQIPYTALHSANAAAVVSTRWFDLGYSASIVGERYSLPQNIELNRIDGYADQSVNISRVFHLRRLSLRGQAEVLNLCDVNYDVIKYYPMPGRQYRFSVKITY
ncbi:MAG: TonB-dependent receptor [Rikenellaceae bacterium]